MTKINNTMLGIKKIHFVGIGGVGMSGIAEVLANLNYAVSGSDINKNQTTSRLEKLGVKVFYSHDKKNVIGSDVIVVSSAIKDNNVEIQIARENRIPIIPRALMLSELMRFSQGIAVAGTHGKTTTTSLVASLLDSAGFDPTYVIGGQLNSLGANASLGKGKFFVAEADESDGSFLHLTPTIAIVTNIDRDHLEAYDNDFNKLKSAFVEFLNRLPFYGFGVLCIDDSEIKDIYSKITRKIISYGFSEEADVQAVNWQQSGNISSFTVKFKSDNSTIDVKLNLPGKHNVLNSLASIAVAKKLGVENKDILNTLLNFQGIGRRFQVLGNYQIKGNEKEVTLVDDYGHHPKEVKAVIDAIRSGWPDKRLVMIYQPHRYSRTKALFDDFANVLSEVDVLLMLDVYSAGEKEIVGADTKSLCNSIRTRSKLDPIYIANKNKLIEILENVLNPGDMLLMQGAGDIGKLAKTVAEDLNLLCGKPLSNVKIG